MIPGPMGSPRWSPAFRRRSASGFRLKAGLQRDPARAARRRRRSARPGARAGSGGASSAPGGASRPVLGAWRRSDPSILPVSLVVSEGRVLRIDPPKAVLADMTRERKNPRVSPASRPAGPGASGGDAGPTDAPGSSWHLTSWQQVAVGGRIPGVFHRPDRAPMLRILCMSRASDTPASRAAHGAPATRPPMRAIVAMFAMSATRHAPLFRGDHGRRGPPRPSRPASSAPPVLRGAHALHVAHVAHGPHTGVSCAAWAPVPRSTPMLCIFCASGARGSRAK
jgi:hypothetical protein